jgi:hypothetical protein
LFPTRESSGQGSIPGTEASAIAEAGPTPMSSSSLSPARLTGN